MTDNQEHLDQLDAEVTGQRLLVISCDPAGELTIEENGFPSWQLGGISRWLEMYADAELQDALEEDAE